MISSVLLTALICLDITKGAHLGIDYASLSNCEETLTPGDGFYPNLEKQRCQYFINDTRHANPVACDCSPGLGITTDELCMPFMDDNGGCYSRCPDGTFRVTGSYTCRTCSDGCRFCAGPETTDCQRCFNVTINGRSIETCPDHLVARDGRCVPAFNATEVECHPACDGCRGPSAGDCIHCKHYRDVSVYPPVCSESCEGYQINVSKIIQGLKNTTCYWRHEPAIRVDCPIPPPGEYCLPNNCYETMRVLPITVPNVTFLYIQNEDHIFKSYARVENERRCVDTCPGDYMGSYQRVCVDICPPEAPYTQDGRCVSSCNAGRALFSPANHTCVVCEQPTPYRHDGYCVGECPADQYIRGDKCVARCEHYVYQDLFCVTTCPDSAPFIIENSGGVSRSCVSSCSNGDVIVHQSDGLYCKSECNGKWALWNERTICYNTCPKALPYVVNQGGELHCRDKCGEDTTFISVIPLGLYNGEFRCYQTCPDSFKFVHKINGTNYCVSRCPLDWLVYNRTTCVESCPEHTSVLRRGNTDECVELCPYNMISVNKSHTMVCQVCEGISKFAYIDVCLDECPVDTLVINVAHKRGCADDTCPSGTNLLQAGQNKSCVTRCPTDQNVVFDSTCLTECPEDAGFALKRPDGYVCSYRCEESWGTGTWILLDNNTGGHWRNTLKGHAQCVHDCPRHAPNYYYNICVVSCPMGTTWGDSITYHDGFSSQHCEPYLMEFIKTCFSFLTILSYQCFTFVRGSNLRRVIIRYNADGTLLWVSVFLLLITWPLFLLDMTNVRKCFPKTLNVSKPFSDKKQVRNILARWSDQ